jgi:hypothetical protein
MKKLIISSLIVILNFNISYALEYPTISFHTDLREIGFYKYKEIDDYLKSATYIDFNGTKFLKDFDLLFPPPGVSLNTGICYKYQDPIPSVLNRNIGLNSTKILEILTDTFSKDSYKITEVNINKKFVLNIFSSNDNRLKAIYIIKNNICIGYCLLDLEFFSQCYPEDDVMKKIKSLKNKETKFNIKKKDILGNNKLSFYQKNGKFKEVYLILNNEKEEVLLLDSFYPEEVEEYLEFEIKKFLKKNSIISLNIKKNDDDKVDED